MGLDRDSRPSFLLHVPRVFYCCFPFLVCCCFSQLFITSCFFWWLCQFCHHLTWLLLPQEVALVMQDFSIFQSHAAYSCPNHLVYAVFFTSLYKREQITAPWGPHCNARESNSTSPSFLEEMPQFSPSLTEQECTHPTSCPTLSEYPNFFSTLTHALLSYWPMFFLLHQEGVIISISAEICQPGGRADAVKVKLFSSPTLVWLISILCLSEVLHILNCISVL